MDIQTAIKHVIARKDLTADEMTTVMRAIMTGECTPAQIAGFLVGLNMKGETVDEIAAATGVMRELSTRVEVDTEHLVDTCGTGGDGINTFNISTTAAFVTAAAGARVAKHGNRSVSSNSGSADVLEAAGVKLELTAEQIAECINRIGIGFMFAPLHHSAMKHAIVPRRELGVRTLFNLLGPLTNPAGAPNQVLGVFSSDWQYKLTQVLQKLGARHVMVVHADDGMDEISIAAPTRVSELLDGEINSYALTPEQYDMPLNSLETIAVNSAEDSLRTLFSVLDNNPAPATDIVILNAAAAIYVSGVAASYAEGIERAREVIASGAARQKLDELIKLTNAL